MNFKGTFAIENLATSRASVREAAEEMSTFNVVPQISSPAVGEDLADGAEILVALGVPQEELVRVCGIPDRREVHTLCSHNIHAATSFKKDSSKKDSSSLYFKQDPAFLYWFICHFQ